jgi:hypothetical protein
MDPYFLVQFGKTEDWEREKKSELFWPNKKPSWGPPEGYQKVVVYQEG